MNDRRLAGCAKARAVAFLFLALFWLMPCPGRSAPLTTGPILECPSISSGSGCRPVDLTGMSLSGRQTILARRVDLPPEFRPSRPLMVWLVATASSEVRWNGVLIGRNGVPGPDAAHERAGRFIASFPVPPEVIRPGANLVTARLSAHHLWLPVRRAVQEFDIGPYETVALPGLAAYLPALLMLGALAAAGLFFAAARLLDRADRGALLLASVAGLALLQLGAETARSFIFYAYPWHLVRVAAVAVLAALTSAAVAAYAARRFAPGWERRIVAATAAAGFASLILIPWYDIKALAALTAGAVAALVCGLRGWRGGIAGGRLATVAPLLFFLLLAWQRTELLDRAYYIYLGGILTVLVAEQLVHLRHARRGREAEALRADALEEKLRQLSRSASGVASLKDGSRVHRVPEEDILYARAADDYCEVVLRSGRTLLVTMTLAKVDEALSSRFVRVHKSYVVNAAEVTTVGPRPGGGRQLTLNDGTIVPIGRSYVESVAAMEAD